MCRSIRVNYKVHNATIVINLDFFSGEQKWPKEAVELHEQLLVHRAKFMLEKFVGL
jgi:hypothetical protein